MLAYVKTQSQEAVVKPKGTHPTCVMTTCVAREVAVFVCTALRGFYRPVLYVINSTVQRQPLEQLTRV